MRFKFIKQLIFLTIIILFLACQAKKLSANYWYNKGVTQVNRRNYEKAIIFLDRAIAIDSLDPVSRNEKGVALDELKLFDEAILSYSKSIFLKPDYADAYYNRGNAYFDSGNLSKAKKDYLKAIELNPNDGDYKAMLEQTEGILNNK